MFSNHIVLILYRYFWPCRVFFCLGFICETLNTFPNHPFPGEIRIAFVLYKHIGVYLSTENASMKLGNEAMATNYSVIVNSPVITAAINKDSNKVYLSDPVIFTIRHLQVIFFLFVSPLCEMFCFYFDVTASAYNVLFASFSFTHTRKMHMHFLARILSSQFPLSLKCNKKTQILSQT